MEFATKNFWLLSSQHYELPDLSLTGALDMERAYLAGYALWAKASA